MNFENPSIKTIIIVNLLIVFFFAIIYIIIGSFGNQFNNTSKTLNLLDSIYLSMTIQSRVGFGDITPKTKVAKFFVLIQQSLTLLNISFPSLKFLQNALSKKISTTGPVQPGQAQNVTSTPVTSTPVTSGPVQPGQVPYVPPTTVKSTPVTSAPVTSTPVTSTPVTSTPVTSGPVQSGQVPYVPPTPVTSAPVTSTPVTSAPVTSAPVTSAPVKSTTAPLNVISKYSSYSSSKINDFLKKIESKK